MAPIHPGSSPFSIGFHNPAAVRQNHNKQDREDAHFCRRGGSLQIPEFPYAPWSYDNEALTFPDSYVQVEPSPNEARVTNRSLSHPEIRFERAFSQPASTNAALDYNEFSQNICNTGDASYHALRQVSSAAMHRAAKRNSLPYFSPKKVLFIPKYRSADNAIFQKSKDHQAPIPRRHSIIDGSSLFRASTGNLRGKSSIEQCPPRRYDFSNIKMVEVSTRGKRASLSNSTTDFAGASSANYPTTFCTEPKKQNRDSTQPDWDPEPMNLSNTSP